MTDRRNLKIALAHDYLIKIGGAERVLEVLHDMFPDAPLFTLLYDEEATAGRYKDWDIRPSWLNKAPYRRRMVDYYRTLMPQAVESLDLSDFDLVISDASSFIKGIITQPDTIHVSYIHTPTRFLWFDISSHIKRGKFITAAKLIIPAVLHRVRQWDFIAAQRPDIMIANSRTTNARITKFYRRDSVVIFPPVDTERFDPTKREPQDHYLIVSRLEPHKDIDTVIAACNHAKLSLKIIGTGTDQARLQQLAGPTIQFLGRLNDDAVAEHFSHARAYLAPQREDFGITMVEALAAGCPVIARNIDGAAEIVEHRKNGILLDELSVQSLLDELRQFRPEQFSAATCAHSAERFSTAQFKRDLTQLLDQTVLRSSHGLT